MTKIKAVIFDYDGVIADTLQFGYDLNQKVMEKLGAPKFTGVEDFRERFGHYKDFYCSIDPSDPDIADRAEKIFMEEFGKADKNFELFDGIAEVIAKLSEKFKIGIVSNNFREIIENSLKKGNALDKISSIIDRRVENLKPHPSHVFLCLGELGVKPSEACMIGDSPMDIEVAKKAGFAKIVAVLYGHHIKKSLVGADAYVKTPKEILKVLEAN